MESTPVDRTEFVTIAEIAAATTPVFSWHALAQAQADRLLIVSE